jgi:hypothetical protein
MNWSTLSVILEKFTPAAIGVLGTLLGAVVANWNNRRAAQAARSDADRTRFHDRRLGVYTDLLSALRTFTVSNSELIYADIADTSLKAILEKKRESAIDTILFGQASVRLIGSARVREAAESARVLMWGLMLDSKKLDPDLHKENTRRFLQATDSLESAMRSELV